MATKSDRKARQTASTPGTTVEEIPVLSAQERAEFIDSLEASEWRIEAGDCVEYDPERFEDRLLDIDRNAGRARNG